MDGKIPPQNLIRQFNPQSPSLQPGFYKGIGLDVLTVASAAAVGYAYSAYLAGSFSFAILLAFVTVFAIFSTLQVFLTKNTGRRFFILFFEVLALLVFFWGYDIKLLAAALFSALILLFWGELAGKRELESGLEIRFLKTAKPLLSKFTTAIIFVFIILYIPLWTPESAFVSRGAFEGFTGWFSNVVVNFYPEIKLNSSFSELAEGFALLQLKNDQNFLSLAPDAREGILRQAANQVSASLSKTLGVEVDPGEPAVKIFYEYLIKLIRGWQEQFGNFFLVAWGLTIFFVARGFGILFYWLAGILSFIVYQILLASGLVHITGETRTHEVIEW